MPLIRQAYIVFVDNDPQTMTPTEHRVIVTHQDMTRGETMLPKAAGPLNMTTAWVWAALTRMGLYDQPYSQFAEFDCAGIEDGGSETVDPTQPGTTDG